MTKSKPTQPATDDPGLMPPDYPPPPPPPPGLMPPDYPPPPPPPPQHLSPEEFVAIMHPAVAEQFSHFSYSHLPPHLADVSRNFAQLALHIVLTCNHGPAVTRGLGFLRQAKDQIVAGQVCSDLGEQRNRCLGIIQSLAAPAGE